MIIEILVSRPVMVLYCRRLHLQIKGKRQKRKLLYLFSDLLVRCLGKYITKLTANSALPLAKEGEI